MGGLFVTDCQIELLGGFVQGLREIWKWGGGFYDIYGRLIELVGGGRYYLGFSGEAAVRLDRE